MGATEFIVAFLEESRDFQSADSLVMGSVWVEYGIRASRVVGLVESTAEGVLSIKPLEHSERGELVEADFAEHIRIDQIVGLGYWDGANIYDTRIRKG